MPNFCVNTNEQSGGEHEVHNLDAGCRNLPDPQNRYPLGVHASCNSAVIAARQVYANVDGCKFCAPACHTK